MAVDKGIGHKLDPVSESDGVVPVVVKFSENDLPTNLREFLIFQNFLLVYFLKFFVFSVFGVFLLQENHVIVISKEALIFEFAFLNLFGSLFDFLLGGHIGLVEVLDQTGREHLVVQKLVKLLITDKSGISVFLE